MTGGVPGLVSRPFQVVSKESMAEARGRTSKEDAAVFHAIWLAGCPEGCMAVWYEGRDPWRTG